MEERLAKLEQLQRMAQALQDKMDKVTSSGHWKGLFTFALIHNNPYPEGDEHSWYEESKEMRKALKKLEL